ncbi:hypothetical protein DP116_24770, partial [Brasilonema bromeliae SPC951]|nr:hypothetical protein [Brasilonema bromeliae SPC951]
GFGGSQSTGTAKTATPSPPSGRLQVGRPDGRCSTWGNPKTALPPQRAGSPRPHCLLMTLTGMPAFAQRANASSLGVGDPPAGLDSLMTND